MELEHLRPKLHRYCSRMVGSVVDGEDVVQDTLAVATRKLHTLQDPAHLEAWVFRIAHNKAIDHLRRQRPTQAWADVDLPIDDAPEHVAQIDVHKALSLLVTRLPPKERAAILLKDVLDYALIEAAEICESTVGAIKAALHRGRSRLRQVHDSPTSRRISEDHRALIQAYIARFNAQDWDGVCAITQADARIEVIGFGGGEGHAFMRTGYFRNYGRLPPWRLELAIVHGEEHVVHYRRVGEVWQPLAVQVLRILDEQIVGVRDYVHVDYLLIDTQIEEC